MAFDVVIRNGVVIDGLHVERSAPVREGMLWRVSRV